MAEQEPITELNLAEVPRSISLLARSLRMLIRGFDRDEGPPEPGTAEHILYKFTNKDYFVDEELIGLVRQLDPIAPLRDSTALMRLLEILKIEIEKLRFTERVLQLPEITPTVLIPEGRRAFVPALSGMIGAGEGVNDFDGATVYIALSPQKLPDRS